MRPLRSQFLPYSLPLIDEEAIQEVVDSLRSGWVTTGPKVRKFEEAFAEYTGSRYAVALNSCTAALHIALASLGIRPGDEVIVPTLTFCSTANVVIHLGATPILVDVDKDFQISMEAVAAAVTHRTRAIVPVHYAGQACDLDTLLAFSRERGIPLVEDAAHAAGSEYKGVKIGTHGAAVAFSFYATKNMTTGEGGMLTTNDSRLAELARKLSLHGMTRDAWKRYSSAGSWYYEVTEAGYKYNMTDVQAALGLHQLRTLDAFTARRQQIAASYDRAFSDLPLLLPRRHPDRNHVYHLYPVQLVRDSFDIDRADFINKLTEWKIGSSVHFIPVHRHPYYQQHFGYTPDRFPHAEEIYSGLLSLPLYPRMSDSDVEDVIHAVRSLCEQHATCGQRQLLKSVAQTTGNG